METAELNRALELLGLAKESISTGSKHRDLQDAITDIDSAIKILLNLNCRMSLSEYIDHHKVWALCSPPLLSESVEYMKREENWHGNVCLEKEGRVFRRLCYEDGTIAAISLIC